MNKINWALPLETVDGRKVISVAPASSSEFLVTIEGDIGAPRFYRTTGEHTFGSMPSLRNVAAAINTAKDLQTVDGKAVKYLGTLADGQIVVDVKYGTGLSAKWATELRRADGRKAGGSLHSPDDVIVKVDIKVVYRNVYADGTTGATKHLNEKDAKDRTKYGKVRVGTLKQTFHDGVMVDAILSANVQPWFRDFSAPTGRAAVTADYSRK